MPRTAREAFLASTAKEPFSKLAESVAFDTACEYALLTLVEEMPAEAEPNLAWTQHAKIIGARRAIEILRTLHVPPAAPAPYKPPQLKPPK